MNAITLDFSVSKPVDNPTLRVLSFGAGVQSTVILFMAMEGAFGPRPDLVIFADPKFEGRHTYEHWQWVRGEVAKRTNGQTETIEVSAGDIRADHLRALNTTGQRVASMPLYTGGGKGMGRRQCTREYKIEPIEAAIRSHLGVGKGKRVPKGVMVEQWIGLSTDELPRLKLNPRPWATNRWPLIEARMNRGDCRAWWARKFPDRSLFKSACLACPFRDNEMWRWMKINTPDEFEDVCQFDEAIRENGSRLKGMNQQQFVHRSGVPLREADLDAIDVDDMFQNDCDGMCGT